MPVSKPTAGATGWNVAVDEVIDIANSVADLPDRVATLEASAGSGDVTEAELAAGLATKAPAVHNHTDLLDQTAGDNRYILQTNANAFAPADATTTALAGKQPLDADLTAIAGLDSATAGTVASDGAGWVKKTYAQMRTALGLATIATSGKVADATDVSTAGAAVGQVVAVAAVSGTEVAGWGLRAMVPAASAAGLRRLIDAAVCDRQRAAAASRIAFEDAPSVVEQWAALTSWSSQSAVQVSGGRAYSAAQGGNSGINRSFPVAAGEEMRMVAHIRTVSGLTSGGLIVGVTKGTAGAAPAAGGADLRGLYFRADVVPMTDGVAQTGIGSVPAGTTDWVVTVTVDQTYITATAVTSDGVTEIRYRWTRSGFTIANIGVFNSDSRQLTGHSVGPIGARRAPVTVTPRTGIEGVQRTVAWTTIGTAGIRVALPPAYDSRRPAPVLIAFHGNGSDETHWASNTNGKAVHDAFLTAGYIVVSAAYTPGVSTWGAQPGLDAYVAAYQYVRDRYAIGPVVLYGNSMGGLESLLTLAERRIPAAAWIGTVPATSLATAHASATFQATIRSAYGVAGDGANYAALTAGHDPALLPGHAFRGLPMWVLIATDDTAVPPAQHWSALAPTIEPYAAEITRVDVTGGHSTASIEANTSAMVAFANRVIAP